RLESAGAEQFYVVMPNLRRLGVHIVDRYLTILKPLGLPTPAHPRIELTLPAEAIEWAQAHWPAAPSPCALLNISGTGPTKDWGADRYIAFLAAARQSHPHIRFALCGHPRDEQRMASIACGAGIPRSPCTQRC